MTRPLPKHLQDVAEQAVAAGDYPDMDAVIEAEASVRLVEMREDQGVVTPANAVGKREILVGER